jgi:ribosomal protein S11
MGEHYKLRSFNDTLITYGDLTFKQIRRLMFRD